MQDVITRGTGGSIAFGGMPSAGKTGTTTDYNDVWLSAYTPYYTATTWAGYDNNTKLTSNAEKNLAKTLSVFIFNNPQTLVILNFPFL